MSLVAYGSSDESSGDEGNDTVESNKTETKVEQSDVKLRLPTPKHDKNTSPFEEDNKLANTMNLTRTTGTNKSPEKINFTRLPKPKSTTTESDDVIEEVEDDIALKKEVQSEKPAKRDRGPIKITVPALSEFKDLEEENETKKNRAMPSAKGTGLFALLPPPKGSKIGVSTKLIPQAVKASVKSNVQPQSVKKGQLTSNSHNTAKGITSKSSLGLSNYDSNSEDEDDAVGSSSSHATTDFFSLTETEPIPNISGTVDCDMLLKDKSSSPNSTSESNFSEGSLGYVSKAHSSDATCEEQSDDITQKTLVSNVMNLPKEEILLKNKAEVGPKLPVPEQEYNVDLEGNVAFDEKAIEYLCGKRGVKRKNKEIDEANIIEINGEDIKPDEREWLVKALTEEPVVRPVSMQSGGVNSQSKKKHQITYLAHQAKAMEMELKNQWAVNRMTRKQTQSKYGF